MTAVKYENVWKLLNKYNFEIDSALLIDLTCVICKKIVRDCRQSCCGCRYCSQCIRDYLSGEDKICPGSTDDCNDHVINFDRDVEVDHVANMKVSKLLVKCPESACQHSDELRCLVNHINAHNINCPYFEIGCDKTGLTSSNIDDHLNDNEFAHSMLSINALQQLKNELVAINEDSKKRISSITDSIQNEMENLKRGDTNHSRVIENLKADISALNNTCDALKRSKLMNEELLCKLSSGENEEIESKIEKLNAEIVALTNKFDTVKKRNAETEKTVKDHFQKTQDKAGESEIKFTQLNTLMFNMSNRLKVLTKGNEESIEFMKNMSHQVIERRSSELQTAVEKWKSESTSMKNQINVLTKSNDEKDKLLKQISEQSRVKNEEADTKFNKLNNQISDLTTKLKMITKTNQEKEELVKRLSRQIFAKDSEVEMKMEKFKTDLRDEWDLLKKSNQESEKSLKNALQQLAARRTNEEQENFENSKREISTINDELNTMKKRNQEKEEFLKRFTQKFDANNANVEGQIEKINTKISILDDELALLKSGCQEQHKSSKELSQLVENNESKMVSKFEELKHFLEHSKHDLNVDNLPQHLIAPFEWKIENFSSKRKFNEETLEEYILSEPFYSHKGGYKLCLIVFPNGSSVSNWSHLSVGFCLMKGEYDDKLPWPMMHSVTISLLYQSRNYSEVWQRFDFYSSPKKYKACFNRPVGFLNQTRAETHFINLNVLTNNNKLYHNDSIILSCSFE